MLVEDEGDPVRQNVGWMCRAVGKPEVSSGIACKAKIGVCREPCYAMPSRGFPQSQVGSA